MDDNCRQGFDPGMLWADWTKSAMTVWQSTASTWQDIVAAGMGAMAQPQKEPSPEKFFTAWRSLWSGSFKPEVIRDLEEAGAFAEVAMGVARSFFDGCVRFQNLVKTVTSRQPNDKDPGFTIAQQEIFQAWMEFHEKEVQPLLRMPQVGLTRFYQEKVNQLVDRFNLYQAALAEFQYLLCLPMEKSLVTIKDHMDKGAEGESKDFKDYYAAWIKTLEGQYMELFRSAEWNQSLSRLVEESANFRMSRNEIMMDLLQFLPIPTNRDMDEVYKELYTLKKMVKEMAKRTNQQEPYTP